ncbi:MAG: Fe-S cluster assembly protein SufD [Planctomycetaceae bacterium]|nr:Fe-S cluster assembly protein SufD [Planctomycetaceae bacterium]
MTTTARELGFTQEAFESLLESRHEPAWMKDLRRIAWKTFNELNWPARNDEEWIRTDMRLFKLDRFVLAAEPKIGAACSRGLLGAHIDLAGQTLAVDGHRVSARLDKKWADKGVIFGNAEGVLAEHGDLIQPYFLSQAVNPYYDRFSALHAAFWTGGSILYVPRGVTVDQPFHALSALSDGASDLGHTLVILEDGAEATMLSETESASDEAGGFHCGAIELIVRPGANLRYVNPQNWGHGVWHFAHQKALVDRDASLQWTVAAMGAKLAKVNQHVGLVGAGAYSQVNGVMFTQGKQHLSYHTLQHHEAESCRSDFLYKAALQDKSRTVWRGMIKVDPEAQKTNGYQRNDNLILSSSARADSIPGLEIEADDVRCTHGSTSGRVDEELIFYARCRGYTRKEAIQMIVTGFFQQVFDRITIDSVREALGHAIAARVREYE